MCDLIDRQDAIDAVSRGCHELRGVFSESEKNLNELPSVQLGIPDINVRDMISRQAAIDILEERILANGYSNTALIAELNRCIGCLMRLPSAQPEQRWIPVTEKLPEERGFYLVSVGSPYKTVRVYEYKPCEGYENENLWKNNDGSYCFNWFVEAWMPLPEPWKEGADV